MAVPPPENQVASAKPVEERKNVVIRFAGDSGDGMQLTGMQFTTESALMGNDISTLPDFPAEIRAPAGTLAGVSAFQVNFATDEVFTPGDDVDALVAMNPAALKVNLGDLKPGGILIVNTEQFNKQNLSRAGYTANPLEDGSLVGYQLFPVDVTKLTIAALQGVGLSNREALRCRNFFCLGMVSWLFHRPIDSTLKWVQSKFKKLPDVLEANTRALRAGFNFGDTTEMFAVSYEVKPATISPGLYRNITGNTATALGLVAAARKAGLPLFLGSYPITPASDILHELSAFKNFGVTTFQAEDEIAAVGSALGAAFGGSLAVTTTSGPGMNLKMETIGLAITVELPMVIVDIQRAGPSTGMPTKTEQADLLQAMYGRHGEAPLPVLAAITPSDCFDMAFEAARIAVQYMTPVILLTDGYLANGAEPWKLPSFADLPSIAMEFRTNPEGFFPYVRDERTLARPWVRPGTPGLEHRVGGLSHEHVTGNVSYSPANHEQMIRIRARKIAGIARDIPPTKVTGADHGKLLVIGWGGTYGAIEAAVQELARKGESVGHVQLRYLNPLPSDLPDIMARFDKILVPELNMGQLVKILRAEFLVDAIGMNKVQGRPFKISELVSRIRRLLKD
ncbi:MAG: 2-oxoglutarate/2-oxoacid ferredoxin oxidoreductase subunit alpha [Candidatus Binatota bacterium]|nr:2-oxoglutarate/2-oxoacid ferredoxin oxidoreductase subunit alpha [Candidatus Binatota bacterium]